MDQEEVVDYDLDWDAERAPKKRKVTKKKKEKKIKDKKKKKPSKKEKSAKEKSTKQTNIQKVNVNIDDQEDEVMVPEMPSFTGSFGGATPQTIDASVQEPVVTQPFIQPLQQAVSQVTPSEPGWQNTLGYGLQSALPFLLGYGSEREKAPVSSAQREKLAAAEEKLERLKEGSKVFPAKDVMKDISLNVGGVLNARSAAINEAVATAQTRNLNRVQQGNESASVIPSGPDRSLAGRKRYRTPGIVREGPLAGLKVDRNDMSLEEVRKAEEARLKQKLKVREVPQVTQKMIKERVDALRNASVARLSPTAKQNLLQLPERIQELKNRPPQPPPKPVDMRQKLERQFDLTHRQLPVPPVPPKPRNMKAKLRRAKVQAITGLSKDDVVRLSDVKKGLRRNLRGNFSIPESGKFNFGPQLGEDIRRIVQNQQYREDQKIKRLEATRGKPLPDVPRERLSAMTPNRRLQRVELRAMNRNLKTPSTEETKRLLDKYGFTPSPPKASPRMQEVLDFNRQLMQTPQSASSVIKLQDDLDSAARQGRITQQQYIQYSAQAKKVFNRLQGRSFGKGATVNIPVYDKSSIPFLQRYSLMLKKPVDYVKKLAQGKLKSRVVSPSVQQQIKQQYQQQGFKATPPPTTRGNRVFYNRLGSPVRMMPFSPRKN